MDVPEFMLVDVTVTPPSLKEDEFASLWSIFKSDFKKVYASVEEELERFVVFKANVDFITAHNKEADVHGYTTGINQFADMSSAEFKATMLTYQGDRKKPNPVVVLDASANPTSVDWTTKGAVTPVKNQGQCGSCWAFSTTGSAEGAHQIATGKLVSFSEQELVDCAGSYGNQGCNGGLMDDGFKYLEAKGDSLEASYAYTGKTGTCNSQKQSAADGIKAGAVGSFHDVTTDSLAQMEAAVAQQPVSVAIEADQSGFQFYKTGVFSGTCGTNLDHGVLVVGYGTDSGKDYWKVKNSWGATWGQEGYILLTKGDKTNSTSGRKLLGGGGGGSGECGLLKQPSYPVINKAYARTLANQTHYGDPAKGCMSDEQPVKVQGLSGDFCAPDCKSAACPTDVPAGVTAKPQCALQSSAGDKKCALICSPSTDEASLRVGDAQCGAGTCSPIQSVGICTYGGSGPAPSPPGPSPPPPSAECDIPTGLKCAESVEPCIAQCKSGVADCIKCLGPDYGTCCPCLKKVIKALPCPSMDVPEFMLIH
jgi:C1A family cysteine protease